MAQRRRRYKRKGRRVKRKRNTRGKGERGVRYFKLRQTNTSFFATSGTGTYALKVNINDPSVCTDWSPIADLFDCYRVCAFKIQYIPFAPNDTSGVYLYAPSFTCVDYNNLSSDSVPNVDSSQQYENNRLHNLARPWKRYIKVPKVYQYQPSSGVARMVYPGYFNCDDLPQTGFMYFNAAGLTASKVYGSATFTWYIKVRNRR